MTRRAVAELAVWSLWLAWFGFVLLVLWWWPL